VIWDGPMSMAYDRVHHLVYSSNWRAGVWKLDARRATPQKKIFALLRLGNRDVASGRKR
jgi:hypothetical protein